MANLTGASVLIAIGVFFQRVWAVWIKFRPIIDVLAQKAEELAKDGVISKQDRKILVTLGIEEYAKQTGNKLGIFEKIIISWAINKAADKLLPYDIDTSDLIKVAHRKLKEVR